MHSSHGLPPPTTGSGRARLSPGELIADRYRIERFIAEGASARVYAVRDQETGRQLAAKVVCSTLGEARTAVDRFQHETLVCHMFDSPHLPRVYDQGRLPDGAPFMVMEMMTGVTLDRRLEHGPLPMAAALDLGKQMMEALKAAHAQGIAHCDIKPQNLMLEPAPKRGVLVKLLDFGIATRIRAKEQPHETADTVLGTPSFMSPEQIRGERVDERSDIYSASVVLYLAVTGRLPFAGKGTREVMRAALRDVVVPPRLLRDSCPVELERVLMRGLCRDKRYRYPSARKMGQDLEWIASHLGFAVGRRAWKAQSSMLPPRPDKRPSGDATTRRVSGERQAAKSGIRSSHPDGALPAPPRLPKLG